MAFHLIEIWQNRINSTVILYLIFINYIMSVSKKKMFRIFFKLINWHSNAKQNRHLIKTNIYNLATET